ncbi:MAG: 3-hydroxyacyl-CoA dehydrogenase/enoyl-CoA hydratase family protein [Planctomycetota bacterium]|jgi:enoyl-CoA hydratase/3-hydroxyacyl-CoA dehydrogenase
MAFEMFGRTIRKIGVVGSGQIGPDIALHFSKEGVKREVSVVVVDIAEAALEAGQKKLHKKIDKGVAAGAFKPDQGEAIKSNTLFTSDDSALSGADLIIEAATEDLEIKRKIFARLEEICAEGAILASNSSHMSPEVIFAETKDKSRALVIHYFFPAERNLIVEIVPGTDTVPEVTTFLMRFYEQIGKVPLHVRKSRFGFAVDPVFEGLFQAVGLLVEEGLCTVKEADAASCKALGQAIGPFTAMNLTGGTPLATHGIQGYGKEIMPWFNPPPTILNQLESGEPWPTAARGETVELDPEKEKTLGDLLLGAYFGLCSEVVDSGVSTVADLDMAVEIALVMKPPFRTMNKVGPGNALKLVEAYAKKYPGFKVPELLRRQAEAEVPFDIPMVLREDHDDVAVVTIRRPRVLNALNAEVVSQIDDLFEEIAEDGHIRGVVLTGFGVKAFVSGADIRELAALPTPEAGEAFARKGQGVLNRIEAFEKPVLVAMNGLAFGGGNELAMACHARIAAKGQRAFAGQPEPKLGVIPGYGGSQRLVRWVGFEKAWPVLRTGNPISSAQALEAGLILEEVDAGALVDRAVARVREAASGSNPFSPIPKDPVPVPDAPEEVDIGHLSRRIDAILKEATLEGAKTTLAEGLALEAKKFGECLTTRDAKIGMENFMKNGPKVQAEFVHE